MWPYASWSHASCFVQVSPPPSSGVEEKKEEDDGDCWLSLIVAMLKSNLFVLGSLWGGEEVFKSKENN